MTLKEAAELLLSVKSKRKGIDKDTKKRIRELEKDRFFEDDVLKKAFHNVNCAKSILLMKENDFFNPKEIGRLFLSEAIRKADGPLKFDVYKSTIEVASNDYGNEYCAGLGDKEWAMELLDYAFKNIEMDSDDKSDLDDISEKLK